MATITEKLAQYAFEMKFTDIPEKIIKLGKMQLMNLIATIFAGTKMRPGQIALEAFQDAGGNPPASIITTKKKVGLDKAVFINGVFAQALDYEDYGMPMHCGCTTVPVSLGYTEVMELSGKELLLGMIIGNEISCRIGLSLFPSLTTGQTCDPLVHPISAAVIGAKLMNLNLEQMTNAIGIAAYLPQWPILKGFFGPHTKTLTSALPAQNGVIACQLAAKGFTGSHNIFDAPDGFCNFMTNMPSPGRIVEKLDYEHWLTNTLAFKLYPGCAYLDAPLDCVFEILEKNPNMDPDEIKAIKVKLPGLGTVSMDLANRHAATLKGLKEPDSSYAILNFNVPYNIAAALIDKELTPKQFLDDRIFDPKIHELAKKVTVETDIAMTIQIFTSFLPKGMKITDAQSNMFNTLIFDAIKGDFKWEFGARVLVKMKNGEKYKASTTIAKAAPGNHDKQYIIDKFKQEAAYIGFDSAKTNELIKIFENIEEYDSIQELLQHIT
ncbi:MAG: MmgE/PrpD family protein [Candidatus Helarchaeota archaeon]|nr:MmgE/PrpD family protein [Candidatus Helarchaeota archaeon]